MDARQASRVGHRVSDALTGARQAFIVHRLPSFAACWIGTTTLWSAVLIAAGLLALGTAAATVTLQGLVLLIADRLCRSDRSGRRVPLILVGMCVLLGVSSIAMFTAARGSGEALAFVLLTLYLAAALFFAWGWRAQMALWVATVLPWLAVTPLLTFALPTIDLLAAIVIGSVLSWAIAEGTYRTFRSAWAHRAAEARTRRALEDARDTAEAATHAKDQFLATLSHELRSPLSTIFAWTQLLRRGRLDAARARHALDVIERSVRLQVRLIEDLLDVSRIASGKLNVEVTSVDLSELVRAAVDAFRENAGTKRIDLTLELRDEPLRARVDPLRIQQVLTNLLSNAVKFTAEGGRVTVGAQRQGDAAEITVRDTGIGMSPEVLERMFERFHQADSSIARRHGGLGLGLAIARHLVELHGGSIEGQSGGLDQGATFRVRLPLEASAPESRGRKEAARPEEPLPSLAGLRVMVVDDEPEAREFFSALLSDCGATVTAAGSVAEAISETQHGLPDVLVADLAMPHEDGFALIRRLRDREHAAGTHMRAIAVTALAGAENRSRAIRAGFDVHLTKPVEADAVVAAVAGM